jgi:hypothetical protein
MNACKASLFMEEPFCLAGALILEYFQSIIALMSRILLRWFRTKFPPISVQSRESLDLSKPIAEEKERPQLTWSLSLLSSGGAKLGMAPSLVAKIPNHYANQEA